MGNAGGGAWWDRGRSRERCWRWLPHPHPVHLLSTSLISGCDPTAERGQGSGHQGLGKSLQVQNGQSMPPLQPPTLVTSVSCSLLLSPLEDGAVRRSVFAVEVTIHDTH